MKVLMRTGLFFFVLLTIVSCKKNEMLTDTQRIENELKSAVQNNSVTKCNIYLFATTSSVSAHNDVSFEISDGFIIVKKNIDVYNAIEYRYNLLFLSKYEIVTSNNTKNLSLYFSNISPDLN
jgi:hypothetical protein